MPAGAESCLLEIAEKSWERWLLVGELLFQKGLWEQGLIQPHRWAFLAPQAGGGSLTGWKEPCPSEQLSCAAFQVIVSVGPGEGSFDMLAQPSKNVTHD